MGTFDKNRNREAFSFANINLLGRCNVNCYFCLGKDIEAELAEAGDQTRVRFDQWGNFDKFLQLCHHHEVSKIYVTGQNTDSLVYQYLNELVDYLHYFEFQVGLRTNGFLAPHKYDIINKCELSTGYSIHTLTPMVQKMMLGTTHVPDYGEILRRTERPRVQTVITRCNVHEFFDVVKFVSQFGPHVRYLQARRVSTDTRQAELEPDARAYEELYTYVSKSFPMTRRLWGDAEEYNIYNVPVCFWRTVKTTINSMNYFTDGTISDEYFVVEGYMKNRCTNESNLVRLGNV